MKDYRLIYYRIPEYKRKPFINKFLKKIIKWLFVLRIEYYEKILIIKKCNGCGNEYNDFELNFGNNLICKCGYTVVTVSRLNDMMAFNLACYGREYKYPLGNEYYHWRINYMNY